MKIRAIHFNIILLAALVAGCATLGNNNKEVSAIELYLEANADGTPFNKEVPIYRAQPVMVNVNSSPFADDRDLENATVVEDAGGFAIALALNQHGSMMLENATRSNPGKRIVVFANFGESRWLAAPRPSRPIANGQLIFTPDASREEAERLVRGLTNVIAEIKKK
jgi:preprotein translocase subunit SecD